jgi:hypothetical protein
VKLFLPFEETTTPLREWQRGWRSIARKRKNSREGNALTAVFMLIASF